MKLGRKCILIRKIVSSRSRITIENVRKTPNTVIFSSDTTCSRLQPNISIKIRMRGPNDEIEEQTIKIPVDQLAAAMTSHFGPREPVTKGMMACNQAASTQPSMMPAPGSNLVNDQRNLLLPPSQPKDVDGMQNKMDRLKRQNHDLNKVG